MFFRERNRFGGARDLAVGERPNVGHYVVLEAVIRWASVSVEDSIVNVSTDIKLEDMKAVRKGTYLNTCPL